MTVELLTKHHLKFLILKGGCTGSPESTLVKLPHCWKSRVMAHFLCTCTTLNFYPVTCSSAVLNMYFQSVENSVDHDQMALLGAPEQLREKLAAIGYYMYCLPPLILKKYMGKSSFDSIIPCTLFIMPNFGV